MKVIVAGGRDFNNYELLKSKLDSILGDKIQLDIEIVSGACRGADKLGERYATERGLKISKFPADWDRFKTKAGFIRNKSMAQYATHLIAFWDGKSKGTKDMITQAGELIDQSKIRIIKYSNA